MKKNLKNSKFQTANEEKVAVITGTSSGIGFETALAFARDGYYTYATMRDTSKGDIIKEISQKENLKIDVLELDVDKEDSVKTAIKQILDQKFLRPFTPTKTSRKRMQWRSRKIKFAGTSEFAQKE